MGHKIFLVAALCAHICLTQGQITSKDSLALVTQFPFDTVITVDFGQMQFQYQDWPHGRSAEIVIHRYGKSMLFVEPSRTAAIPGNAYYDFDLVKVNTDSVIPIEPNRGIAFPPLVLWYYCGTVPSCSSYIMYRFDEFEYLFPIDSVALFMKVSAMHIDRSPYTISLSFDTTSLLQGTSLLPGQGTIRPFLRVGKPSSLETYDILGRRMRSVAIQPSLGVWLMPPHDKHSTKKITVK